MSTSTSSAPLWPVPVTNGAELCAELVNKIETSTALTTKKRIRAARKKLKTVVREQRRIAKKAKLYAVALTLTYRNSRLFDKKHISAFLDYARRAVKREGHSLPYAWVLESAAQLHYHLILWLPHGYRIDMERLAKWWRWGSSWIMACRSVKAWSRYMAKFDAINSLPKNARLFGAGGLDEDGRCKVVRSGLPSWLLKSIAPSSYAKQVSGRGWKDIKTGTILRSPYSWTPWGFVLT